MSARPVLTALMEYRAGEKPNEIFLKMPGIELTWGEFFASVCRVANGLREAGVRRGERVAIMLPNCPAFLYAHFGAISAGAVPVPINTGQR
jgi:acyl-CoA synthetase (AMP-forming)/AMP-acid ligase II